MDANQAGDSAAPAAPPLPGNLRPERDARVSDATQARGVDAVLRQIKPSLAGNSAKEQLADKLWEQLEKDKVAMAAPQRARLAVEKLPTDLLISRPFAPNTSGGSSAAEDKPRSRHDGSGVAPPRFGKVVSFPDGCQLMGS